MPNENDNTRAFINLGGHSGKTIKSRVRGILASYFKRQKVKNSLLDLPKTWGNL